MRKTRASRERRPRPSAILSHSARGQLSARAISSSTSGHRLYGVPSSFEEIRGGTNPRTFPRGDEDKVIPFTTGHHAIAEIADVESSCFGRSVHQKLFFAAVMSLSLSNSTTGQLSGYRLLNFFLP